MSLKLFDQEVFQLIREEEKRQKNTLDLIASENYASQATIEAQASILANKLAEGYIGKRLCAGCEVIDKIEKLAIERAKALFGAEHVNIQCLSATQANVAVYSALLDHGDAVLAPKLSHGGHFSHGSPRHISGKSYRFFHYGVSTQNEQIDIEEVEKIALEKRPKLIIAGMSAYPRKIEFSQFRKVTDKVGALLLADIAHVVGLIIANLHPHPVPHADVVTSSTHKTFRGPRGCGIIMCRKEFGAAIDEAVFPGNQGAPVMNIIASRAILLKEAMSPDFTRYQMQVLENARVLAEGLASHGIRLVSGGTDTHLILIDLRQLGLNGNEVESLLYSVGIATNKNLIPFDEKPPHITSGVRLGTAALTTRGMKRPEMEKIGTLIARVLLNPANESELLKVQKESLSLARKFPLFSNDWI
ncbi:MAG: serine hydroxymethyltransferase [Deltaproteobacteria bacterium]|nr:serine hydroxymethyltransferase [Deltaproteobacteria bacterium]